MRRVKLFISHASEDKKDFVLPLAEALRKEFEIWLDKDSLIIGKGLLEQIDEGLRESDHGVVILSPSFFVKDWPQRELDGLLALEEKNKKAVLPIWKDIDFEGVRKYSAILASRYAVKASDGVEKVIDDIRRAVEYFERGKSVESPKPGIDKLKAVLQKQNEKMLSDAVVSSMDGVHLGRNMADATMRIFNEQIQPLRTSSLRLRVQGPREEAFGPALTVSSGTLYLHAEYQNDVMNSARTARLLMSIGQDLRDKISILLEKRYSLYVDQNRNVDWASEDGKEVFSAQQLVDAWLGKFGEKLDR